MNHDAQMPPVAAAGSTRRRPWLAALLSLLLPGLGQLYAGRWRRALAYLAISGLIDFGAGFGLWSFGALLARSDGLWLAFGVILLGLAFRIFAVVDAVLITKHSSDAPLARYQRWYIYVVVPILWLLPHALGLVGDVNDTESYSIRSSSMAPAAVVGDYVLGVRIEGGGDMPARGTIVTHVDAATGGTSIRRVIGLPGDTVELRDGILILNGDPVDLEPVGNYRDAQGKQSAILRETLPDGVSYLVLDRERLPYLDDRPPVIVPPDQVFLMGDNRDSSKDSRITGPVPMTTLEAQVLYIYWSTDLARIGTRLE